MTRVRNFLVRGTAFALSPAQINKKKKLQMIILIVSELLIDFFGGILVIILSRFMIIYERNLNFIWVRYTFVQTFIV